MEKPMNQKKFQTLILEQFAIMRENFVALKTEMRDGFKEVHAEITAIKAILNPVSKAVDTDAEKILDHGKRLLRVEKVLGVKKA